MKRPGTLLMITFLASCLVLSGCGCEDGPTETIQIKGQTFELEVASDSASIARGLGGRTELARDRGMIFVFPNNLVRRFWMKDCLIDIDIMFLDGMGRITTIHQMEIEPARAPGESMTDYEARLPRYPSTMGAQYAIELGAGRIEELGLQRGDKIEIPHDCLKQRLR